jgi:hypothetical protein
LYKKFSAHAKCAWTIPTSVVGSIKFDEDHIGEDTCVETNSTKVSDIKLDSQLSLVKVRYLSEKVEGQC